MEQVLIYPLRNVGFSGDPKTHGYNAYDFYWYGDDHGVGDTGPHPPLYAMADGVVTYIYNGAPNYRDDNYGYGNRILISYDNGYVSLYAHCLKDSFKVKVGDRVKQCQQVCNVDNSGHSLGAHLHMEICKGSFTSHGGIDYVSKKIIYARKGWNFIDEDCLRGKTIVYENNAPIQVVPMNILKNQLKVSSSDLRIRKAPTNGEVVGYCDIGYYDVDELIVAEDFTWARVKDYYIAIVEGYSEYMPISFKSVEPDTEVDQFKVDIDCLRIRSEANTSSAIMGYAPIGYYNVDSVKVDKATGLTFYQIQGYWLAGVSGTSFIKKENKDLKRIEELKDILTQINTLSEELTGIKKLVQDGLKI